jgi:hypothetical protein
MACLPKEVVHSAILQRDYSSTFASLRLKLSKSNIALETEDEVGGHILTRPLTLLVSWIFWCVSTDKLLFELRKIDQANTEVKVYTIPSRFKHKLGKHEKAVDLRRLITRLLNIYTSFGNQEEGRGLGQVKEAKGRGTGQLSRRVDVMPSTRRPGRITSPVSRSLSKS